MELEYELPKFILEIDMVGETHSADKLLSSGFDSDGNPQDRENSTDKLLPLRFHNFDLGGK